MLANGKRENPRRAISLSYGFTLIELMVVIVIIGVLVAALIPSVTLIRAKAKETQVANDIGEIHKALEQFGVDHSGKYPYRVRHFPQLHMQTSTPDFDSAISTTFAPLGLFGGAEVLNADFSIATVTYPEPQLTDAQRRYFNQRTDPLVAMGYMKQYPQNPFLRRGMACDAWGFDPADMSQPSPDVRVAPGDFVYTFYMVPAGAALTDPPGVVLDALSYTATTGDGPDGIPVPGVLYLSLVDGYQLWAYGVLRSNGLDYMCYSNSSANVPSQPVQTRGDWNGNGKKDMFETGIITYFQSEPNAAGRDSTTGQKQEY